MSETTPRHAISASLAFFFCAILFCGGALSGSALAISAAGLAATGASLTAGTAAIDAVGCLAFGGIGLWFMRRLGSSIEWLSMSRPHS